MTFNNQELGQGEATAPDGPVDFAFLSRQTFDDFELQRDVLSLFLAQSRRLVPMLGRLGPREQGDTAHLLKGSARGIGAWAAAEASAAYETAEPEQRVALFNALAATFTAAEAAIVAYLDTRAPG